MLNTIKQTGDENKEIYQQVITLEQIKQAFIKFKFFFY